MSSDEFKREATSSQQHNSHIVSAELDDEAAVIMIGSRLPVLSYRRDDSKLPHKWVGGWVAQEARALKMDVKRQSEVGR